MTLKELILYKSNILRGLRNFLYDRSFVEVTTPVARNSDCRFRPRPVVNLYGKRYLRESVGPALRRNLQFLPKIYEIGPCFRHDKPDRTHAPEFYMLDLYAAGESMEYLLDLAEGMIRLFFSGEVSRVSIATAVREAFGVDLVTESEMVLREKLIEVYGLPDFTTLYDAVETYVERELEPKSEGRCLILHDYPLRTEVCAKRKEGTTSVINRFELYIDRVEVIHGYEDEDDRPGFVERATEINFYNAEQKLIQDEIERGTVPSRSVGLGVGVERLCMSCSRQYDMRNFISSQEF